MGLIPARAGTTNNSVLERGFNRAHPRSRGDHNDEWGSVNMDAGSSPLARGPQSAHDGKATTFGLIPARAGTTVFPRRTPGVAGAHPRSRGDHYPPGNAAGVDGGSSPLARGPRFLSVVPASSPGLIPARAGTTAVTALRGLSRRAHPRSRGDH